MTASHGTSAAIAASETSSVITATRARELGHASIQATISKPGSAGWPGDAARFSSDEAPEIQAPLMVVFPAGNVASPLARAIDA
ncbi:hypothetical protein [Nannocystis punicea]|uniref:Uncharacterized protein n=1 Tax=Nannocystis punicea TaxID=2995304 RepID=A0ABY7H9P0_9BACT|nr:hypothetical protein [Nannocystis poenicansa]WAS95815.1 hypothetical protein O0S08_06595 [Nannocystis poenicansa]